ncbi:MAG: methionine--tRNA ligase [Patescibacteria group bacterium]|jgi:methionyl-tRNA synthetase
MEKENILVAAALPYANNSLHLGHVAALMGSDIFARYKRQIGNNVLFVSGSDCHGTPISVEAEKRGIEPSEIALKYHEEFKKTLIQGLGFSYDIFSTTTTDIHKKTVQEIFLDLYNKELIYKKTEKLPYCENDKRFLPDRYIEGVCPNCGFGSARGDQCDNCGKLIDPKELKNPKCKICGSTPIFKDSEHFFLKLTALQDKLSEWVKKSEGWKPNALGFAENFLKNGLQDRAITRDTTWGIEIPLVGFETKRIYVWFEAVCGYLSASKEWAEKTGDETAWESYWVNNQAKHYYFHGKDNIPFHTIIWPAILIGFDHGLHLPDRIYSTEYLNLEGKQFSKSRHWAVWLPDFLEDFDPETLRFYLTLSGPETADADFSWKDYKERINAELIGNFGNFINRTFSIIKQNFDSGVRFPETLNAESEKFIKLAEDSFDIIGNLIEQGKFREAIRALLKIVEYGNKYFNDAEPWKTVKENKEAAEETLAVCAQIIRAIAILSAPFLPRTAEKISAQTQDHELRWKYPEPKEIFNPIEVSPLFKKIEEEEIEAQREKLGKE